MCEYFSGMTRHFSLSFTFFCICKADLRLHGFSGERGNSYISLFSTKLPLITRKVLLCQTWDVKSLAHSPFPFNIAKMISQPVYGHSRLKRYLYFLADPRIQVNHLPAVETYLNRGPFIRGTPGESPPYVFLFFFSFGLLWLTLFLSAISESVSSPLTTPPKCCSNAWRRNDLCCSYLWVSELIF